ncbi:MAG: phosphopantetheine-binding protein [Micromonosporaceae bacterium]
MNGEYVTLLRPYLKYAGDQEITGDARLRDLGLDSMRAIELLFAVEDTFGVVIPDEKLTNATFETARSLWSVIEELREPARTGQA